MEELLSLKWNNHRSTFLHILGVLRDKQSYTDVTLACDGKFYSVHKLVLSTCSDYFCAMFEKTSCKSPVIVLKDIKSEDLEALLDYMYLGEVNVRQSDLASLIKAAENLRIKGLAVPDDEPPKKSSTSSSGGGVSAPSRRDSSPPAKRKRRAESEDGREDVRPSGGGDLHTPPPPSRPKSPAIQRLSPSPHRTPQESRATEDRDNRPLPSPAETTPTPHSQAQVSQQSLQSAQQLGDPGAQTMGNNQYGAENPPYVKVEVDEEDTDGANRDSFDMSSESFKEEGDVGGSLSNDLPEFLQQAASSALAGTSGSYHQSFAGPSGFQPEVSSWHADGQSMPGNFPGMNFPANTSQDNPPGIGAQLHGNVCKVCGKVFNGRNWKQNLEYHSLTHTKEKPYKCPICPHSSALKYNLIRHIRNRHWEVLAPMVLNSGREREDTEPMVASRDEISNQESVKTATERIVEIAAQLNATLGSQSQNQPETNLSTVLDGSLANNPDTQMSACSNGNQGIQNILSNNLSFPLAPGNIHQQDQLLQMASHLNPLNMNLDLPITSGNQDSQIPSDSEMQVSNPSQGSNLFTKGGNHLS